MLEYKLTFIGCLKLEILSDGGRNKDYTVIFSEGNNVLFEHTMKPTFWAACDRQYLSDITITIKRVDRIVKVIKVLDEIRGKRVYISLDSKSVGDTLAWMPYCLEFKNKYNCEVLVSTFHNDWFKKVYPELQFLKAGSTVQNIHALFNVGIYYDATKSPHKGNTIPLQQVATDILHLDYTEIKPRIYFESKPTLIEGKYVAISTKSTSEMKLWHGWQGVIDYLIIKGYKVVEVSHEACDYQGIENLEDRSMNTVMNIISGADFYIGLSSGLSWMAWTLNIPVFMISNFTTEDYEFKCYRITNTNVCHGCWKNPMFKFDAGDWWYCPEHAGTSRQFECHKSITPEMVIAAIGSNR